MNVNLLILGKKEKTFFFNIKSSIFSSTARNFVRHPASCTLPDAKVEVGPTRSNDAVVRNQAMLACAFDLRKSQTRSRVARRFRFCAKRRSSGDGDTYAKRVY